MSRVLSNYLDTYERFCRGRAAPKLFRQWAGVLNLLGALEKRCWVTLEEADDEEMGRIYPNLGVFLIAEGGVGKKRPLSTCEKLWSSVPRLRISPKSLTAASFCDIMKDKTTLQFTGPDADEEYHTLLVVCEEISSFFLAYDGEQLGYWCQALDCDRTISQGRRILGPQALVSIGPSLYFLLAGTPGAFATRFPEAAYDQGLMGRSIIVFGGKKDYAKLVPEARRLMASMKRDIALISELEGPFKADSKVLPLMREIELENEAIVADPPHPRLRPYYNRKHLTAIKVAMAFSLSENNQMGLTLAHYEAALDLLALTEPGMVESFVAPKQDEDALAINELLRNIKSRPPKVKLDRKFLFRSLYHRVPSVKIPILIDTMIQAGLLREDQNTGKVFLCPKAKDLEDEKVVEMQLKG